MLTREQVLDIQTYCAEHKITIGERLGELHIETSQFYRWQRKYLARRMSKAPIPALLSS